MAVFVKLTSLLTKQPIFVNLEHVSSMARIQHDGKEYTALTMSVWPANEYRRYVDVLEEPEEIGSATRLVVFR